MEGRARAAKHELQMATYTAWHMAVFNASTKSKKGLQPLKTYLEPATPKKAQTTAEMLAVLQSLKSGGTPMNIRQVN